MLPFDWWKVMLKMVIHRGFDGICLVLDKVSAEHFN